MIDDDRYTGIRRPRQFDGPQPAIVRRVRADGQLVVELDVHPGVLYEPVRWQRPHDHDPLDPSYIVGVACLVQFVGRGAGHPWVVAFDR